MHELFKIGNHTLLLETKIKQFSSHRSTKKCYTCVFVFSSGPSPAGGPVVPAPHLKSVPPFHDCPTGCCIHPILHFKNVALLLDFGPSFWLLAPLLLNPGDGPGFRTDESYQSISGCTHSKLTREIETVTLIYHH